MSRQPAERDCDGEVLASVPQPVGVITPLTVSTLVIGTLLAIDVMTPTVFDRHRQWLEATLVGVAVGQVNLIAVWVAFAPVNLVVRIPLSLVLTALMWSALVLGNEVCGGLAPPDTALLGVVLLAGVVAAQIPLWIAKKGFRWQLAGALDERVPTIHQHWQFQLRHLLLGTFLVGLAFTVLRIIFPLDTFAGIGGDLDLLALISITAVGNFLLTIPAIWGSLARRLPHWWFPLAWLCCCVVITMGQYWILAAIARPSLDSWILFLYLLVNLTNGVTLFVVLCIFRALGFRLLRAPIGR